MVFCRCVWLIFMMLVNVFDFVLSVVCSVCSVGSR